MPFIYDSYENRKEVATVVHKILHGHPELMMEILTGITELDAFLYSEATRNKIRLQLPHSALDSAEQTRTDLYRFVVKGSNAPEVIKYFLKTKYKRACEEIKFPNSFISDWDTTILINPNLPKNQFQILFEILIPILQTFLIRFSNTLRDVEVPNFQKQFESDIALANEIIRYLPEYEMYTKYPLVFKHDTSSFLNIFDSTKTDPDTIRFIESLGKSGKGFHVSSNRNGGNAPSDTTNLPKFYLGRIMLSVLASKTAWIPVEILDISMNYQNDDLLFSWESYSEYHIKHRFLQPIQMGRFYMQQVRDLNFRVMSATGMYFDLSKCILDATITTDQTKRNKVPARKKRIQYILDSMIIPYTNMNNVIQENLEKHKISNTIVGNIRRKMNLTRKRKRIAYDPYNDMDRQFAEFDANYDPYD